MPLYVYRCDRCTAERTDMRTVGERHLGPTCDGCNRIMKLVVSVVYGFVKNPAAPRSKS